MSAEVLGKNLVSLQNVAIGYGKEKLITGINWDIAPGSLWGIIGPNGVGKTTLIKTLLGMNSPFSGRVFVKTGLKTGYVKQRSSMNETYPLTVEEVILMGSLPGVKIPRRIGKEQIQAAEVAMSQTGILGLKNKCVRELSGGQKQRVLIARALVSSPDLIVLDEPTNDMDVAGEQSVLDLLMEIHRKNHTAVIMVSHLLHTVLQIGQNIMFLKSNRCDIFDRDKLIEGKYLEQYYQMPISINKDPGGAYAVVISRGRNSSELGD